MLNGWLCTQWCRQGKLWAILLALKHVPVRSDTLGREFAEGVALCVQEERLFNVARVHVPHYRSNAELVDAATQVANTLSCTI